MPPRRHAAESLTADDLSTLADALKAGKRATVYVREGTPSLGLEAGSSARVISVDGTTVLVRPRGVNDELPYEADELRMTKNPPPAPEKPKKAAAPRKPTAPKAAGTKSSAAVSAPKPAPKPTAVTSPSASQAPKATASAKPASRTATVGAARATPAAPPAKSTPTTKPARRGNRKAPTSVTITIFGSADNEWSVAVSRGGRKPNRSRSVTPDYVESAIGELGDDTALQAASSILNAAREEAQRRVEELSRELEAARQALAALDGKN